MSEQTTETTTDVQNVESQAQTTEIKVEEQQTAPATETQAGAPAPKPIPQNNPFNLILALSNHDVQKIAKHFELSDVRFIEDVEKKAHLPTEGIKRGNALDRYLGKIDHTVTLAVVLEPIWIEALLTNNAMATSVWRSIESKFFGHKTVDQRNLIIVAGTINGGVRESEEKNKLVKLTAGHPFPTAWRPQRQQRTEKKTEQKKVDNNGKNGQKKVEAKQQPKKAQQDKPAPLYGVVGNPGGEIGKGGKVQAKPNKPMADLKRESADHNNQKMLREKNRPLKTLRHAGNGSPLLGDLYLMCKHMFGTVASVDSLNTKATRILHYHTGSVNVTQEDIVKQLFAALVAFSQRSHWGSFPFLQDLVNASARGADEVAQMLSGYIATIPVRDQDGNEILQPKVSKGLDIAAVTGVGIRPDRFAGGQDALEVSGTL